MGRLGPPAQQPILSICSMETDVTDTNPRLKTSSFAPPRSLRNRVLAGTALGLLIAGGLAAGDSIFTNHPAFAAAVPARGEGDCCSAQ
jgi:hypothetical protein